MDGVVLLVVLVVPGLALLFSAVGMYGSLIHKGTIRSWSIFFDGGVVLGLVVIGGISILLYRLGVYPYAIPLGALYGVAAGSWIGIWLELRDRKRQARD
ncbi:MAG TPA: hypothetical protein VE134_02610 [Methanomicrobiales archaeon]|nr:hypothetical protein [Methanomicrobiales archaeon]